MTMDREFPQGEFPTREFPRGDSSAGGDGASRAEFEADLRLALLDVPVPAGLSERLLNAIAAQSSWTDSEEIAAFDALNGADSCAANSDAPKQRSVSLEQSWAEAPLAAEISRNPAPRSAFWPQIGVLVAMATAAALFLTVQLPVQGERLELPAVLASARGGFLDEIQSADWHDTRTTLPPVGLEISSFFRGDLATGWRRLEIGFLRAPGVVFELNAPGGRRALLYVAESRRASQFGNLVGNLGSSPFEGWEDTEGFAATAWIESERLYVLVVAGDPGDARAFMRQGEPIT